jgi:hypothetical protein
MEQDTRYQQAVEALRDTMADYDEDSRRVGAQAADIFVNEIDKGEAGFLHGIDREHATRVLFVLTTALVLVRDQLAEDAQHLLAHDPSSDESVPCEDADCEYEHLPLDSDRLLGIIDGFEVGLAAAVGITMTVADLAEDQDPDNFDWSASVPEDH